MGRQPGEIPADGRVGQKSMDEKQHISVVEIAWLVGVNLLYACVGVFTKLASQQAMLSPRYIACFCGAIAVIGIYAILWQQILKRIQLSVAYMFKGTTLIFTMLIAALFFGEPITAANIIGSIIIVTGIILLARA